MPVTDQPNVLLVMCDQLRADAVGALSDAPVHTPNVDRLVERGVSFENAYSQCPVCVPARYNTRTGCEPTTIPYYRNGGPGPEEGSIEDHCGPYLARAMRQRGYRTWGIGKHHTTPRHEDLGYDTQRYSEELYHTRENYEADDYAAFLEAEYPEYTFLEQPHGERTEMYYMPQTSPMPAEVTVESWAADRAVREIERDDERPFFGFLSFVGPHPPLAPPIPFNRMYDPDRMPDPIRGEKRVDHLDEQLPWMNEVIWADEPDDLRIATLRARYYGEVSYIDQCLGRVLDAVEAREDAENTLICFVADHGDHLGDHHAWQKESFFEQSCRIPFLVSWPEQLPAGERRDDLVCLTDVFGIATTAAGEQELRDGVDVLGSITGDAPTRDRLLGVYRDPGTQDFKCMVREDDWKYVYMANGGREQLFDLAADPEETVQLIDDRPQVAQRFRETAREMLGERGATAALTDDASDLAEFEFREREAERIHQFAGYRGVDSFPEDPADVLEDWTLGEP
jgi:choline-sulfatase